MFDRRPPEWLRLQHSPEFVRYARARLSPASASAAELKSARDTLHDTPFVRQILETQLDDGSWAVPEHEWYRSVPRTIEVLLEHGFTLADEAVARAVRHLRSRQRDDGAFPTDDPGGPAFDEAYNAACIRALVAAGLREHPATRAAAERLLSARRHDGGWSTLPPWWRQQGVPLPDPEPSCPICTDLAVFALGLAVDLPAALCAEFLAMALHVVAEMPAPARAESARERLAFMANQGMRAGQAQVDDAVRALLACRGADGSFADHESPAGYVPSALAEVQSRHLLWRLGVEP